MPICLSCVNCGAEFMVGASRAKSAKFCSRRCSDVFPRTKDNVNCINCGKPFHVKPRELAITDKRCCSLSCIGAHRSKHYIGSKNPNYKGRNVDHDGYRVFIPEVKGVRVKEHRYNAAIALGVDKIPSGLHVHHRDCDILNNVPFNLSVMTMSDHNWLHKQFGNATLWAFMNNKVTLADLKSWSDNPERAERLLTSNVEMQGIIIMIGKNVYGLDDHQSIAMLHPEHIEFEEVEELSETQRGVNGFGSSGK